MWTVSMKNGSLERDKHTGKHNARIRLLLPEAKEPSEVKRRVCDTSFPGAFRGNTDLPISWSQLLAPRREKASQSYGFSNSHVRIWEFDPKGDWARKNWGIQTVVLEKTLERLLDSSEINQSSLKEINPEYSLEGLMLKLKLQYFGHLMSRASPWKRPWCWERLKAGEKGMTVDEMVG